MRSILTLLVLVFLINGVQAQENQQNLRVITYNIWNGFDWGKDTTRHRAFIDWVKFQKPDVIALQELCGYTEAKLKQDAEHWGHKHSALLKLDGYPVGISSSQPIEVLAKHLEGLWHGMLVVKTGGIHYLVVHLSPADWAFRKKEANRIVEVLQSINGPVIILGDFNAHSPMDADLDRPKKSLLARKLAGDNRSQKHQNLNHGYFDYSVMSTFFAANLKDITLPFITIEERYSYPAYGLVGIWQTESEVSRHHERIDYILCTPDLANHCIYSRILNGPETANLSDHYPVMADFIIHQN